MEFAIVQLKMHSAGVISFPADLVGLEKNPLAGPFGEVLAAQLVHAISRFRNAKEIEGIRDGFELEYPWARLEIWMSGDGHLFVETHNGLEILHQLFVHLQLWCEDLAIEDVRQGVLHSARSFEAFIRDGQTAAA